MDTKNFIFDKTVLKECCNEKFYSSRRWVWSNRPELVGTVVRAKMTKNTLKPKEIESKKKPCPSKKKRPKYAKPSKESKDKPRDKSKLSNQKERREHKRKDKSKGKGKEDIKELKRQDKNSKPKNRTQVFGKKCDSKEKKGHEKKKVANQKRVNEERPITGNKRPKPMSGELLEKVKRFCASTPHNNLGTKTLEGDVSIALACFCVSSFLPVYKFSSYLGSFKLLM
jgi:hypothetical protein